jgi:hypothetical protein
MDIYPQRPASDHGKSGVNAAELAPRFILAVGQLERDWGHRKPPDPLLPAGINTINADVMQVGSGLGGDCLPEVMGNPAIIPDVAGRSAGARAADPGATGSTNIRELAFLIARRN